MVKPSNLNCTISEYEDLKYVYELQWGFSSFDSKFSQYASEGVSKGWLWIWIGSNTDNNKRLYFDRPNIETTNWTPRFVPEIKDEETTQYTWREHPVTTCWAAVDANAETKNIFTTSEHIYILWRQAESTTKTGYKKEKWDGTKWVVLQDFPHLNTGNWAAGVKNYYDFANPGTGQYRIGCYANEELHFSVSVGVGMEPIKFTEEGTPDPPSYYTLSVLVESNKTGNPISGATVKFGNITGTTGSDGWCYIVHEEGNYILEISAPDYSSYSSSETLTTNTVMQVGLDPVIETIVSAYNATNDGKVVWANYYYWYEGLSDWTPFTTSVAAPDNTEIHILVTWRNDSSYTLKGHADLSVNYPDGSTEILIVESGQDVEANPGDGHIVQFKPFVTTSGEHRLYVDTYETSPVKIIVDVKNAEAAGYFTVGVSNSSNIGGSDCDLHCAGGLIEELPVEYIHLNSNEQKTLTFNFNPNGYSGRVYAIAKIWKGDSIAQEDCLDGDYNQFEFK